MPKFYTGEGDDGSTGLLGEGRLPKHHLVFETVGTIDEASAALGLARSTCRGDGVVELLEEVQRNLYHCMAEIAATPENAPRFRKIDASCVAWLGAQIEAFGKTVDQPAEFILPGDSPSGAAMALARTVIRRAERRVALLLHENSIDNPELLRFLNRLSSLCFVLELVENQAWGKGRPTLAKG